MRIWTLLVSISAHVAVIGAMVVAPIFATGALPEPRRATTFFRVTAVELPTAPVVVRHQRTQASAEPRPVPLTEPVWVQAEMPLDGSMPSVVDLGGPPGNGIPPGEVITGGEPVPPPVLPREAPLHIGGVIQAPTRVKYVEPVYPRLALASRVQGVVILDALIDESGVVREVRVLRSIPLLDRAAVEAVGQWRFTPTLLNGKPVPVVMTVTVAFTLTK